MPTDIQHLSYSSISLYLDCPEAWRRKYIAKEPTDSTPALAFGSAFHGAIEAQLTTGQKAVDAWPAAWANALERGPVDFGFDTPETHFNEGIRLLSNAGVSQAIDGFVARSDETGPMVERKVTLNVPGVPVPVIGYIDFISTDGVPCDLKTSSKSWTDGKAADSLQGLFYLAALNQAGQNFHGWRFRHVVFVKTKEPKVQVLENVHTPGELFFLFRMVSEVWKGITREVFPLNPSSWRCGPTYCDYFANCRGRYA